MAQTLSDNQRLQRLELAVAQITNAIKNLSPKRQLVHINTLTERQFTELKQQVADLQSQLDALKK